MHPESQTSVDPIGNHPVVPKPIPSMLLRDLRFAAEQPLRRKGPWKADSPGPANRGKTFHNKEVTFLLDLLLAMGGGPAGGKTSTQSDGNRLRGLLAEFALVAFGRLLATPSWPTKERSGSPTEPATLKAKNGAPQPAHLPPTRSKPSQTQETPCLSHHGFEQIPESPVASVSIVVGHYPAFVWAREALLRTTASFVTAP
jgi:hypothetical protein